MTTATISSLAAPDASLRRVQSDLIEKAESDAIMEEWISEVVPTTGPIPGAYFRYYTKERVPELQTLAASGSSTATYILYKYYQDAYRGSSEHLEWRTKATDLNFATAISEEHVARVDNTGSLFPYLILGIVLIGVVGVILVGRRPV